MSDEFNDAAIISHAEGMIEKAKASDDFCAALLLAAIQMLSVMDDESDLEHAMGWFTKEVFENRRERLGGADAH